MSPRIKINEDQTDKQLFVMIKALFLACKDREFDGIQAARHFSETFGIYADHHIFTEIMDSMTRTGQARCTQGWGNTRYYIL